VVYNTARRTIRSST